ncbi:Uncharacterized membrane protein [Jannaschia faecimaris]|uniref:Uncharacterized membrane protein n=1 Tax=Jannaschia faecimaris TaxID=1244108 RepID=A0A1H3IHD8_9RHOB|nr:DUF2177 family protein [Jannaschia faecimaris]SDY27273.1 Uncharacterized membrane protein [Jannaschia faecimaris]
MQIVILYAATLIVFAVLDAVMLSNIMKPLFEKYLGDLIRSPINFGPAAVFYLFYIAGILFLVSLPALRDGNVLSAVIGGAVLGAVAYGTYEFTSMSIMRDWSWQMVAVDTTWGAVLTATSAGAGVWAVKAFS